MQPVSKCIRKRVFIRKKKLRQTHVSAFRWEKTGFKIFACNILHSFKTSSNIVYDKIKITYHFFSYLVI